MDFLVPNIRFRAAAKGKAIARPREFDTDDALNGAMNVFWAKGYDGASLPDLLTGMGISRGSLYKAFTDKKTLFLKILETYETARVTPAVDILVDDAVDGLSRIRALFDVVLDDVRQGDRRGCLLCTAAAGPASNDEEISGEVGRLLAEMERGFHCAIDAAADFADLPSEARATMSNLLLTQYVGLRILARAQAPVATLEQSVAAVSLLLDRRR